MEQRNLGNGMILDPEVIARLKKLPNSGDHSCFGCSRNNPSGLRMEFHSDGNAVYSLLAIPSHLCGWGDIVHGGVVSTVMDEIMSWSSMFLLKRYILTKSITVDFLRPVRTGRRIMAAGKVRERINDREAVMEGFIYDESGNLCACSSGTFALFTADAIRKTNLLDPTLVESFEMIFKD